MKFSKSIITCAVLLLLSAATHSQTPPGQPPLGAPPAGMPAGIGGNGGPPLPPGMPPLPPQEPVVYVTAAEVVDGKWQPADPASSAKVQNLGNFNGLKILSTKDLVNGLIVRGKGDTKLTGTNIEIRGRGKSDFDGIAAGVLVKDESTLELRDANIVTRGVVASAVTATDQTRLRVLRSTLISEGGPLPSGYTRKLGPGMMEPPTPLGLIGTARTTLAMGSAHAYYADSTIIAEAWGALSTDAARGAKLEVERCKIIVKRVGYGTYSDNGASVVIRDSSMTVPTFGGIIAGQAALEFDNLKLQSQGNVVMIHSVMGQPTEIAELKIRGGNLHSTNASIVVKSANADILIDKAKITTVNGDLLLGVVNDDSFATKTQGAKVAGIKASIKSSDLTGNLVHLDPDREMNVRLEGSKLRGRIQGITLSLDPKSQWTATSDSSLKITSEVGLKQIDALKGTTITAQGIDSTIAVGKYTLASGGSLIVRH